MAQNRVTSITQLVVGSNPAGCIDTPVAQSGRASVQISPYSFFLSINYYKGEFLWQKKLK